MPFARGGGEPRSPFRSNTEERAARTLPPPLGGRGCSRLPGTEYGSRSTCRGRPSWAKDYSKTGVLHQQSRGSESSPTGRVPCVLLRKVFADLADHGLRWVILATKPIEVSRPVWLGTGAPGVVGKSNEPVNPVTYTSPTASTAMPRPLSKSPPPRYVENASAVPVEFSIVTNASKAPWRTLWRVPVVVGKFGEPVKPVR